MNNGVSYSMFYEILLNLREYFHSYGRIDDSNAKLDEIVKMISINYEMATKGQKFSLAYIRKVAKQVTGDEKNVAAGLINVFEKRLQIQCFSMRMVQIYLVQIHHLFCNQRKMNLQRNLLVR